MPTPKEIRKRGGVVRVRTKRLPNGQLLRVYVFNKPGKRGGRTYAEKVGRKKEASRG
jgi:hypothetical protein